MQVRIKKLVKLTPVIFALYLLGALTVYYQLPPFQQLAYLKNNILINEKDSSDLNNVELLKWDLSETELLKYAFTDPLPRSSIYSDINSLEELNERNKKIFISTEDFYTYKQKIEILNYETLNVDALPIIKVNFKHKDNVKVRTAYMYGEIGTHTKNNAALIIPGSGHNQSLGIYTGAQDNYHCCLAQKIPGFTVFVQVKPNEDFRAWGNSLGKVNTDFHVNWHLNRGGSYSASYVLEAAALNKFLKSYFEKTALLGLSQGGAAALIATYLEPADILVVSSGHSVITENVLWSGHNQIIIPGIKNVVNRNYILDNLEIPFLLTYGKEEIGLYKLEAETKKTCKSYSAKKNIECLVHEGAHVFPEVEILEFLNRNIR